MPKVLDERKQIFQSCLEELNNFKEDTFSEILLSEVPFITKSGIESIWKVETGLYDNEDGRWLVEELTLYLGFKKDFPYSIPVIFIDKEDFEKIGQIPHISSSNYDICVFDSFVVVDSERPTIIIREILEKAKNTLIEGIKGRNLSDYEKEITAYWTASESGKPTKNVYFHLLRALPTTNKLGVLSYIKEGDKFITNLIFNEEEVIIKSYKDYLYSINKKYEINSIFFIGTNTSIIKPPFDYNNFESLELIDHNLQTEFTRYFNQKDSIRTVVFHKLIEGKSLFLGWRYKPISKKINGFRKGSKTDYELSFSKNLPNHKNPIIKFKTDDISEVRIINRTTTEKVDIPKYKFLVAGLGSVGSHIVYYLNNINFPDFSLIDNDYLEVENIGRHLLGVNSLYSYKVEAIGKLIKGKLPSQNVDLYRESFYDLYCKIPDIFNVQDYIFLCTGVLNLETLFIKKIYEGSLKKPIFIIWVEPFLIGGQCLYIHPDKPVNLIHLYSETYKYKYSVIQHKEYEEKRDLFIQKEIGCQSSFSPYSSAHLSLFLSSIYTEIFKIIESNDTQSKAITWFGDFKIAQKLDIAVNNEFRTYKLNIKTL